MQIRQAIELALQQQPAPGALQIEHIALEGAGDEAGGWSRTVEEQNAEVAASDPIAVAYIGPYYSGAAAVSIPITRRAGLLQIGISTTWPGLTEGGWDDAPTSPAQGQPISFLRMAASDSAQAIAAAQWASDLGVRNVFLVDDGSSYSRGQAEQFRRSATATSRVVEQASVLLGAEDDVARRIVEVKVDAVFYAPSSVGQAMRFADALSDVSLSAGVLSTDTAFSDQFRPTLLTGSPAWRTLFNGSTQALSAPQAQLFRAAFFDAYGVEPGIFAAFAYDAARLVALEVGDNAEEARQRVLSRVPQVKGYTGASGPVTFDGKGDREQWVMEGYRWAEDHFEFERLLRSQP